jgi:hypothetical protein
MQEPTIHLNIECVTYCNIVEDMDIFLHDTTTSWSGGVFKVFNVLSTYFMYYKRISCIRPPSLEVRPPLVEVFG